jgi:hypothetical protein
MPPRNALVTRGFYGGTTADRKLLNSKPTLIRSIASARQFSSHSNGILKIFTRP